MNESEYNECLLKNKKAVQEGLLAVSELRPHHMLIACVTEDGKIRIARYGGDPGLEALMLVNLQTVVMETTRRVLGMVHEK